MYQMFIPRHYEKSSKCGMAVEFENGYKVSIIWGKGSFSDSSSSSDLRPNSKTAELAIVSPDGELCTAEVVPGVLPLPHEDDRLLSCGSFSHCTPSEYASILTFVKNL